MSDKVDPFKDIGRPETWGRFGDGERDHHADAERRAMCDHFLRRMKKAERHGEGEHAVADILAGGMTAFAGLFISAAGGASAVTEEHYGSFVALVTFSWYQALSCFDEGSAVQ